MPRVSEQISKANATSQGRPDANLANDSNHLGGVAAEEYATKKYVQDYHNGKEENLKQHIDQQDASVLNKAKEYTNSQIRNQDFSNFAEIEDLQALNSNLTSQITQGLTKQKNYTDQKTNQIVNDVNANFQDVENSISSLNGTVNNLFGSVSNGKAQVAEAITDKGVPTSASDSYSTMASNIRSIPSGGGSGTDPNYVNTSDGTATASDILLGKTAYVKGEKLYGTLIAQPEEGYPTYGTDTSNATATPEDIMYGKTAYARGQLLTGTLRNSEVEEIYGIEVGTIEPKTLITNSQDIETGETIGVSKYAFSPNLDYCVRLVTINGTNYVESYEINSDGLIIHSSTNGSGSTTYKKYRYTYEELGLAEGENIVDIKISNGGVFNRPELAYLYMTTYFSSSENAYSKLYIKPYHLHENGVIGKEYENEDTEEYSKQISSDNSSYFIAVLNNQPDRFFLIRGYRSGNMNVQYGRIFNNEILTNKVSSMSISSSSSTYRPYLTPDDKFLYSNTVNRSYLAKINSTYDDIEVEGISYYSKTYLQNNHNAFLGETGTTTENEGTEIGLWNFEEATTGRNPSIVKNYIKKFWLKFPIEFNYVEIIRVYNFSNGILAIWQNQTNSNNKNVNISFFNKTLDEIIEGEILTPTSTITTLMSNSGTSNEDFITYESFNFNKIFIIKAETPNSIMSIEFLTDSNNIIGVKYKNKAFYLPTGGYLTAGAGDVKAGKTFIGANGVPETGTMEVSE